MGLDFIRIQQEIIFIVEEFFSCYIAQDTVLSLETALHRGYAS